MRTIDGRIGWWGIGRSFGVWEAALLGVAGSAVTIFALLPGDLTARAAMALHGLCAQRPAHTFALGGRLLPFDARMTGIYLGVLVTAAPLLLARRRGLAISWPWLALLLGGVIIMGMDGLNSLRVDLGLPAWWATDNRLRLATGLLAGASLGVALIWLLNAALWPAEGRLLRRHDALGALAGLGAGATLVLSGAGWALTPVTLLLVGGALFALVALNLALLSMVATRRASSGSRPALTRTLTLALGSALLQMALLAGGRYLLEATLGRGLV